jgi:hypothetical protein
MGFVEEAAGAFAPRFLDAAEAAEHSRVAEDCWYRLGLRGKAWRFRSAARCLALVERLGTSTHWGKPVAQTKQPKTFA